MSRITVNSATGTRDSILQSLIRFPDYIFANAIQDFLHKYTGTAMGLLWNAIHPFMMVVVFSVIFTFIIPARFSMAGIQDVSFVVFLCSGLLPWLSFVDGLQRATSCFVDN